jgi:hypothetical protein
MSESSPRGDEGHQANSPPVSRDLLGRRVGLQSVVVLQYTEHGSHLRDPLWGILLEA